MMRSLRDQGPAEDWVSTDPTVRHSGGDDDDDDDDDDDGDDTELRRITRPGAV